MFLLDKALDWVSRQLVSTSWLVKSILDSSLCLSFLNCKMVINALEELGIWVGNHRKWRCWSAWKGLSKKLLGVNKKDFTKTDHKCSWVGYHLGRNCAQLQAESHRNAQVISEPGPRKEQESGSSLGTGLAGKGRLELLNRGTAWCLFLLSWKQWDFVTLSLRNQDCNTVLLSDFLTNVLFLQASRGRAWLERICKGCWPNTRVLYTPCMDVVIDSRFPYCLSS